MTEEVIRVVVKLVSMSKNKQKAEVVRQSSGRSETLHVVAAGNGKWKAANGDILTING